MSLFYLANKSRGNAGGRNKGMGGYRRSSARPTNHR